MSREQLDNIIMVTAVALLTFVLFKALGII